MCHVDKMGGKFRQEKHRDRKENGVPGGIMRNVQS